MISCLRGFGRGNGLQSEPKIGRNDAVSVEMSIGYITQVLFALAALNVKLTLVTVGHNKLDLSRYWRVSNSVFCKPAMYVKVGLYI
jgi:hypothetical protein